MNIYAKTCCVAALLAASLRYGVAQEQRHVMLVERVGFSGDVDSVLVVARADTGAPQVVEATWIAPQDGAEFSCVGRITLPESAERLQVLAVVIGTQGEVRSAYREMAADELPPTVYLSLPDLRARFLERRAVYRTLQGNIQAHTERLRTLQSDADAIAMVSKIVSAEDELTEAKAKLQRVAWAEQGIDRRAAQMKTRPQPLNAQKREAELVSQLSELSQALSAAETQALQRLRGAKGALQEKLALIEETKDEHIGILEEDLARLHRAR